MPRLLRLGLDTKLAYGPQEDMPGVRRNGRLVSVAAASQPRLLDRRAIAAELGIPLSGAERVMRDCEKIWIGRRVYVERAELERYLKRAARR